MPFADRLPKPEDVVASGYDFAEQLLAIQRKFAEDLLQATEPLIPASAKRAWQDATKEGCRRGGREDGDGREDRGDRDRPRAAPKAVADATPKPAAPKPPRGAQVAPRRPAAQTAPKAPAAKAAPKAPAAQARAEGHPGRQGRAQARGRQEPPAATPRAPKATGTS